MEHVRNQLNTHQIENGFTSHFGKALVVSYLNEETGCLHYIELHLTDSGCLVIGADQDVKYTF